MDPALAANSSTTPLQPSNDGPTSSTSNGIVDQITPTHYPTTSTTPKYQSQLQSPSSRPVSQGPPPREELKADSFSLYQASKEDLSLGASTPTPTPSLRSFSASSTTSSKSYKSKLSSAKTTLRSLTKNFSAEARVIKAVTAPLPNRPRGKLSKPVAANPIPIQYYRQFIHTSTAIRKVSNILPVKEIYKVFASSHAAEPAATATATATAVCQAVHTAQTSYSTDANPSQAIPTKIGAS